MKTVKITYDNWWEATIEVDESAETVILMREQLLFWTGGQDRIDGEDDDLTYDEKVRMAYVRMLASELIHLSTDRWTLDGMISQFVGKEGWGYLDGTHGVTLTSVDTWEFQGHEFSVDGL